MLLEPIKFEPSEEQKSTLLSSFRQLVNCLSADEILDCVAMKIFEKFSLYNIIYMLNYHCIRIYSNFPHFYVKMKENLAIIAKIVNLLQKLCEIKVTFDFMSN